MRSFSDYLDYLERAQPFLYELIAERFKAPHGADEFVRDLNLRSWEFEGTENGGRGTEYNRAQQDSSNRGVGMRFLLSLFRRGCGAIPLESSIVLDALAGDGTVHRFAG